MAATAADIAVPLLAALLGGGVLTALLTLRPQRDSIIATAAKTAVEVIATARDQLERDLQHAYQRIDTLEHQLAIANEDRHTLRNELEIVRRRIHELETRLAHPPKNNTSP
jgi:predicted  nucleic acid-binding Zn-ribbon protein